MEKQNAPSKGRETLHPLTMRKGYFPVQVKGAWALFSAAVTWRNICIMQMQICRKRTRSSWQCKDTLCKKPQEGSNAQPLIASPVLSEQSVRVLPQGWALQSTKDAAQFSAKQTAYLDEKIKIGEQTEHKTDLAQVPKYMRQAKHEDGSSRFTADKFLTPQQIKSYFSRTKAKLPQGSQEVADEGDTQAVAEQTAYLYTCAHVLKESLLIHLITYGIYNTVFSGV